jgi:hypothetical protein
MNMSFNIDYEIDSEATSIDDVLLCWESEGESEEDDEDSIQMIHKIRKDFLEDTCDINVIPASPRTAPLNFEQCNDLGELMQKYPAFVPKNMPKVPVKRSRPLCTFVNFLGTRDQPKKAAKKTAAKAVVAKPMVTKLVVAKPMAAKPVAAKPVVAKHMAVKPMLARKKVFEPSPYPTDAPTGSPRPCKKQKMLPTELPVVTPTGYPKPCQKIFDASPMPTLAPTRRRKTVSPTP